MGKIKPAEAVRESKTTCGSTDVECGLYARMVYVSEPAMEGAGPAIRSMPTAKGQRERQTSPDGWSWTVFSGRDTFMAVERRVEIGGHPYVVQALKRMPSRQDRWARYTFKLFEADGTKAKIPPLIPYRDVRLINNLSDKPDGFHVRAETEDEARIGAALWESAFYQATKMFLDVDACVPLVGAEMADCAESRDCRCFRSNENFPKAFEKRQP